MSDPPVILVVDDEELIRSMLARYLSLRGYRVVQAENGIKALELAASIAPDMVISDIQMPLMDGFELLGRIKEQFPAARRILMTGYDIEAYLRMIRDQNVGNIFPKGSDFGFDEVSSYVERLLSGEIFGLDRYFCGSTIHHALIRCPADSRQVSATIVREYGASDNVFLEIALDELISNAVFHGALNLSDSARDTWPEEYLLNEDQAIRISWSKDSEKIGVAIEDRSGNLRKVDVLRWMDHPVEECAGTEEHGRGLLLVRRLIDRFIININPGRRTECILLHHLVRTRKAHQKPLLIHEL